MNKGNLGIGKLATLLDNRMSEHGENKLEPDFGEIKSDMSLVMDNFPTPISKDEYSVCRSLSGFLLSTITGKKDGDHSGHVVGDGKHTHQIPKLKVGDRVLVVWVNDEPTIIDVIIKGTDI